MTGMSSLWEFLSRDAAFFGGPQSPMLSWLGSFGIMLFFLWHVIRLTWEVSRAQRPLDRVRPMLTALAHDRGDVDRERFTSRALVGFAPRAAQPASSSTRIDCDDLNTLDMAMQKEPMFLQPWAQFRKTLILEHVPWFVEPRIFSTRRAEDIFTQDALLSHRVNLTFYSQLPSLVTGIGLLLRFLALFIGLSKLHADGHEIVGIQGLINGLAGKFLTSIVGLIAANLFTLIEKPMVSRLMNAHHTFLGLMDKLFPRKTMEQMLEQLTPTQSVHRGSRQASGGELREYVGSTGTDSLTAPIAELTTAIRSFTKWKEDEQAARRRMMTELPRALREEFAAPMKALNDSIHDLTTLLKDSHLHRTQATTTLDDLMSRLTDTLAERRTSSDVACSEESRFWPKRSMVSTQRPPA
ncbi:MAG TPA: hypothetical protein VK901_10995 [Nitrospiraceae bacterium]|nr:hypothetical protein [Nitrospiraceae bacterium]